jgi:hypothetical protein
MRGILSDTHKIWILDFAHLERAGCAMVFTGTMNDFFPEATNPERIRTLDPGICAKA